MLPGRAARTRPPENTVCLGGLEESETDPLFTTKHFLAGAIVLAANT